MSEKGSRRRFLQTALVGGAVAGGFSLEERILLAAMEKPRPTERPTPKIPAGALPLGKIGKISLSRLFLGGNLIGGWAHSRDLMYVSSLFKAYNTEAKIFETLALAEACGINTVQIDPSSWEVLRKYRKQGGKIQTMICIGPDADARKMNEQIKTLVDQGATMLYTHGEATDHFTMAGQMDVLAKAIDLMKAQGVPGGIGSHSLETPMACEKNKLQPDYYVKTFHHDRYWSATPKDKREEWCWYKGSARNTTSSTTICGVWIRKRRRTSWKVWRDPGLDSR